MPGSTMVKAYYVRATRNLGERDAKQMLYVAAAESPDEAIETVALIVGPETDVSATGDEMTPRTASAIGLQHGKAKLV